jgi:hypothetical protein
LPQALQQWDWNGLLEIPLRPLNKSQVKATKHIWLEERQLQANSVKNVLSSLALSLHPHQHIHSPAYLQPSSIRGSGPEGVENFPRKNGAINGPGTGTSDDIPAMLSDGEFVFTAKSVRNMGGGSRRKGAAKMYKLMKMLEGGPVGKTAKA